MASLGTAYVVVKASLDQLKPGLDKAKKTVRSSVEDMRNQINRISLQAAQLGVIAFSAAFVYNMKKSIDAASDLEEVVAKFGTVYADQIKVAEKNAKVLVDSYGLSTRAAKQYLASVQDLLVPMGMASGAAAKMSNEVVKLSVDLGSFNNLPTEQVMQDIQSAMVGNFETMKKYGVVLNQATVTQEALNTGLIKTKDELNANIKAQAAYQLIVKGSTFAIGDWARTSGGFANQMKQLRSNIENLRAEIGKPLLDAITPVVKAMNDWVMINKAMLAQDIKGWIGGVIEVIKVGIKPLQLWADLWKEIGFIWGAGTTIKGARAEALKGAVPSGQIGYPEFPPGFGGVTTPTIAAGELTAEDQSRVSGLEEAFEMMKDAELSYREWEMEQLTSSQEYKLAANQDYHQQAIELLRVNEEEKLGIALEALDKEAAARKNAATMIVALDEKKAAAQITIAKQLGTALLAIGGASNEAIFIATKAFDIGVAIISGYTAGMRALAELGPIAGPPVQAAMIAQGYWTAAAIAATAIGQLATSSAGAVGGGTYTSPTITTPTTTGVTEYDTLPEDEKRGTLTINIQGDFIGDEAYIDMLVDKINAADDRDVFINKAVYAREVL